MEFKSIEDGIQKLKHEIDWQSKEQIYVTYLTP